MKMTFDPEACAAYIQLATTISTVNDSWPPVGRNQWPLTV